MKAIAAVLLATLVSLTGLTARAQSHVEGSRRLVTTEYRWVGKLSLNGSFACAAWLLKHGVAVTAKHCFTHKRMNQASVTRNLDGFQLSFGTANGMMHIGAPDISAVHFDTGANDIAFVTYKGSLTEGKVEFNHRIMLEPAPAGLPMFVIGFPAPGLRRTMAEGCRATGVIGTFPPKPKDIGYDGPLEETSCGAWYGVSGGAVFAIDNSGPKPVTLVYGVLAHTFAVNEDGSIDQSKVKNDELGPHSSGVFSPFRASQDLRLLIP
jgi:hypothetical protein